MTCPYKPICLVPECLPEKDGYTCGMRKEFEVKCKELLREVSRIFHEGEDKDEPVYYSEVVKKIDEYLENDG